jgi:hypothetical protein
MPIPLGVLAVAGAGAGPVGAGNAYEWLETTVLAGTAVSVEFTNLDTNYASTYQHLQLRIVGRVTENRSGQGGAIRLRFNSDSGTNYRSHQLYGDGSSVVSNESGAASSINLQRFTDAGATANAFGAIIIDILDPFESTKNTTIRQLGGNANNDDYIFMNSGLWNNTAAITTIYLQPLQGINFEIGSRFSLYGMRSS